MSMDMKVLRRVSFLLFSMFALSPGPEAGRAASATNSIRILDINVWSGLNYHGHFTMGEYEPPAVREKRFQALCSQIRQLNPDVVGINEANKLPDYAERLARETSYEVFYHVGLGGVRLGPVGLPWNLREGDAVLAKKSLNPEFVGRKQLSGGYVGDWVTCHFADATQIVAIRITVREKPVYLFVTHWHSSLPDAPYVLAKAEELRRTGAISGEDYQDVLLKIQEGVDWRLSEAKGTTEFIRKTAEHDPYVLMGDFNAEEDSQEIKALLRFGMSDAYRLVNPDSSGFTWDPRTNLNYETYYSKQSSSENDSDAYARLEYSTREIPKRIDYLFLGSSPSPGSTVISVVSCRVAMTDIVNGAHTSDHYGVFAEIQLGR